MFETILNNPGLQHLAENIFFNLDVEHLQICEHLNQSSKLIFDGPMFQDPMYWLKQFKGLSIENQNDWANVMQTLHDSFRRKYAIISYLRWNLKKDYMVNLPCYSSSAVQEGFRSRIWEISQSQENKLIDEYIVKILAPLTDNPNAPDNCGRTPIHWAALKGHTEIVKILAPLTDNPNASNKWGDTPISVAKNTEIRRFLES